MSEILFCLLLIHYFYGLYTNKSKYAFTHVTIKTLVFKISAYIIYIIYILYIYVYIYIYIYIYINGHKKQHMNYTISIFLIKN